MYKVLKRYSTDSQDATQQSVTIDRYLKLKNIIPVETVEESEHGDVSFLDRALGDMIMSSERGTTIIVSEFTRLSRDIADSFLLLKTVCEKGITLYTIAEDLELNDSGDEMMYMKLFMSAFPAEVEIKKIRLRTKEAFVAIKQKIKENGSYVAKKSGRTITKLGNTTNLAEAQRLGNIASAKARKLKAKKNARLNQAWSMADMLKKSGLSNDEIVNKLNTSGFRTLRNNLFSSKNITRFVKTYAKVFEDGEKIHSKKSTT